MAAEDGLDQADIELRMLMRIPDDDRPIELPPARGLISSWLTRVRASAGGRDSEPRRGEEDVGRA